MQSAPEQMEVDAKAEASDGSTSDTDDSEYEDVEVSMEDMANITKLETELEASPNIYDVHLQVTCEARPLGSDPVLLILYTDSLLLVASGDRITITVN